MKTGQYIALFGQTEDISAAQRRTATLVGGAIAEMGFGCTVDKLSGALLYALQSLKEAGGLTMAVLEQAHSNPNSQGCDILLIVQDTQSVYERIAAASVGAIFLDFPSASSSAIQAFKKQGKPVVAVAEANDERFSNDCASHQGALHLHSGLNVFPVADIKKAISQLREMASVA